MVSVEYLPGASYLRVRGTLNDKSGEVLACMVEQALRQGGRRAVVDLRRVRRVDAAALEALQKLDLTIVGGPA